MYRRAYLLLLLVRVYFALSPSYIHPDEHFQGPEILAGHIIDFPSTPPWEFTSATPIRSIVTPWLLYGLPMTFTKWLTPGLPSADLVYKAIRGHMLMLTFILEDWAVQELVPSRRRRQQALILCASSYVTWTYQSHCFSNSVETVVVLWCLVLIRRVVANKYRTSIFDTAMLGLCMVVGVFNRVTFPAFTFVPALQLVPHFFRRPFSLITTTTAVLLGSLLFIAIDTGYYTGARTLEAIITALIERPIITPLNNLLYNTQPTNLADHGLHPRTQHFLINLPQLLGPAYPLILTLLATGPPYTKTLSPTAPRFLSALSATALLSAIPHQEPRFLLPCVPMLLSSIRKPLTRSFWAAWLVFNAALGLLMGVYHQGGVVPAQTRMRHILDAATLGPTGILSPAAPGDFANVYWWKTYMPPTWLLGRDGGGERHGLGAAGGKSRFGGVQTVDLKGVDGRGMIEVLEGATPLCRAAGDAGVNGTVKTVVPFVTNLLVAPASSTFLDAYVARGAAGASTSSGSRLGASASGTGRGAGTHTGTGILQLHLLWSYKKHINLDDLDIPEEGMLGTLRRVVGRRGLNVWAVSRDCGVVDVAAGPGVHVAGEEVQGKGKGHGEL